MRKFIQINGIYYSYLVYLDYYYYYYYRNESKIAELESDNEKKTKALKDTMKQYGQLSNEFGIMQEVSKHHICASIYMDTLPNLYYFFFYKKTKPINLTGKSKAFS